MTTAMMMCGHAANAERGSDGSPACAICAPAEAAYTVAASEPDLTGRMARCNYAPQGGPKKQCLGEVPSKKSLAFFSHKPDAPLDSFYCGCWGWD